MGKLSQSALSLYISLCLSLCFLSRGADSMTIGTCEKFLIFIARNLVILEVLV